MFRFAFRSGCPGFRHGAKVIKGMEEGKCSIEELLRTSYHRSPSFSYIRFMIRLIFALALSLSFIACKNTKSTPQTKTSEIALSNPPKETAQPKIDTTYIPLTIKINSVDSLTIKRIYFDKKDYERYHQAILLNGKQIYIDTAHDFIYESKYNRVIKSKGNVFLFVETDGRPNFNYITAYSISKNGATFISDCVYNDKTQGGGPTPFTDIDGDGFLEYGGFDLHEVPESLDSIYYNPAEFYEIRNGMVRFDSLLAKKADIKENGVHLSNLSAKKGSCCITLKKPKPPRQL